MFDSTSIPLAWVYDGSISFRARGLLFELMTYPEGSKITTTEIVENGTEGRDAVRAAISELVNAKYLVQIGRDLYLQDPANPMPLPAAKAPNPCFKYLGGESRVYYILDPERSAVKIGYTRNLHSRLATLRTASPVGDKLTVVATEPGGELDEKQRHMQFGDLRLSGEWFRYEGALVAHVDALAVSA